MFKNFFNKFKNFLSGFLKKKQINLNHFQNDLIILNYIGKFFFFIIYLVIYVKYFIFIGFINTKTAEPNIHIDNIVFGARVNYEDIKWVLYKNSPYLVVAKKGDIISINSGVIIVNNNRFLREKVSFDIKDTIFNGIVQNDFFLISTNNKSDSTHYLDVNSKDIIFISFIL